MKHNLILLAIIASLGLSACGDSDEIKNDIQNNIDDIVNDDDSNNDDNSNNDDLIDGLLSDNLTLSDEPTKITTLNKEIVSKLAISNTFENMALSFSDISDYSSNQQDSVTGVLTTETEDCEVSGTIVFREDLNDLDGPVVANDFYEIEFQACEELDDSILNGTIRETFNAATNYYLGGDNSDYSVDVTTAFTDYTMTFSDGDDEVETSFAGSFRSVIVDSIEGNSLNTTSDEITITAGPFTQKTTDLNLDYSYVEETNITTFTAAFTISQSLIGGSVAVTTPTPFKLTYQSQVPYEGQLVIAGDDSSITLTVVSEGSVEITYDLDGDGQPDDEPTVESWDDLDVDIDF